MGRVQDFGVLEACRAEGLRSRLRHHAADFPTRLGRRLEGSNVETRRRLWRMSAVMRARGCLFGMLMPAATLATIVLPMTANMRTVRVAEGDEPPTDTRGEPEHED